VCVSGVPNAAPAPHVAALRALRSGRSGTAGELRAELAAGPLAGVAAGVTVDDLLALAADTGYVPRLSWASGAPDGAFDAVFLRTDAAAAGVRVSPPRQPADAPLATRPLRAAEHEALVRELRAFLADRLPAHMVPRLFGVFDAFPLNPAGKIDRDRLDAVAHVRLGAEVDYVAPRNAVEEVVADIVADVLGTERVGLTHDLFDLGAHSLSVTQVLTRITETLQVEIRLRDVFADPSVGAIAALVQDALIAEAELELGYAGGPGERA